MSELDTQLLEKQIEETSREIQVHQEELLKLQDKHTRLVSRIEFIELNKDLYAKTQQTRFTAKEFMSKFRMGRPRFEEIKKFADLKPIGKEKNAFVYELSEFEQAREDYEQWIKECAELQC